MDLAKNQKVLIVSMEFHTPKFEFHGNWSGRDIQTVSSHIRREYFRHIRTIRRANAPTLTEQGALK